MTLAYELRSIKMQARVLVNVLKEVQHEIDSGSSGSLAP